MQLCIRILSVFKKTCLLIPFILSTYAVADEPLTLQQDRIKIENSTRIINGTPVAAGERSFQVSLRDAFGHFCGGSIIADSWVLTAAHCVDSPRLQQVVAGVYDLSESGVSFNVEQVIIHPDWSESLLGIVPDIALIKIDGVFPSDLERLKLADESVMANAVPGVVGIVSGWGLTEGGGFLSNTLLQTTNTIISDAQCDAFDPYPISDDYVICGYDGGGQGSCNGDSGGPYTVDINNETYSIGIVSFGPLNCDGFSAYTETATFIDWINQNIDAVDLSCPQGYLTLDGVIEADGSTVVGKRTFANGTLSLLNIGTATSTIRLYNRQDGVWQPVDESDEEINYQTEVGEYGVLILGSPEDAYRICGRIFSN